MKRVRTSISLDPEHKKALQAIADASTPPVSLSHVVNKAVIEFLRGQRGKRK